MCSNTSFLFKTTTFSGVREGSWVYYVSSICMTPQVSSDVFHTDDKYWGCGLKLKAGRKGLLLRPSEPALRM